MVSILVKENLVQMEKIIHYCWFGDKPMPKLAQKCLKSWKKFLPDYKIMKWTEENVNLEECPFIKGAYENKKWAFIADYVRAKVLNEYGGIYFDTDMEVTKNIDWLFEKDTVLGIEDSGYVAVGVWYEKNKKSFLTGELLKKYRAIPEFDLENITKISIPIMMTEILQPYGLKKGYREIQDLKISQKEIITIYPREYFYPYSYHRDDNIFTNNTCMIHYYDASWIPPKERIEMKMVRHLGKDKTNLIFNTYRRIKHCIRKTAKVILFPIVIYRNVKRKRAIITDEYLTRIEKTIKTIESMKQSEYITIYNAQWFGVSSATKELFTNLVDCGEIFRKKDRTRIIEAIANSEIKQVVFSAFVVGWNDLVVDLKKKTKVKVKTFWHGSHSQILDLYGWERNLEIIELHKKHLIDVMGTCKKSLMNFYTSQGYQAYFITNKVSGIPKVEKKNKNNSKKIIGIYAAKCDDWRKNMYSQMAAIKLLDNAVMDMVPLNEPAKQFAKQYKIEVTGIEKAISREKLLERIANNDVNLYVTFSECAPMLPLESMELGVPCITGNNHHYFEGSELEKYIVLNDEADIEEIKNKIELCIENREKVIALYQEFSKQNLQDATRNVEEFLEL